MTRTIDYFLTMASPWAYLGHAAFIEIAARHGAQVRWRPMPVRRVFDATGGLPLPRRHPARQRYRLVELQRWRERRGLPLHLAPRHSPFDASLLDRVVLALASRGRDPDTFARLAFAGIWSQERDLGTREVVADLLARAGWDAAAILEEADGDETARAYEANLTDAIAADVFGAPSYVLDGEVFWGQDRLDLLDEALASGRAPFRPA